MIYRFQYLNLKMALMVIIIGFLLINCAGTKRILITSDTDNVFIKVNEENVGITPVTYVCDFKKEPYIHITAVKEGYHNYSIAIDKKSKYVKLKKLRMSLQVDEAWKVTSVSKATNEWIRIQTNPKLAQDEIWQKLIDSITSAYDNLEQLDPTSGYIRSVRKIRDFIGPKGIYFVSTQFICSISSKDPLTYKLKIVADTRLKTESKETWHPYNRVFKEDAQLIEELQSRLGLK